LLEWIFGGEECRGGPRLFHPVWVVLHAELVANLPLLIRSLIEGGRLEWQTVEFEPRCKLIVTELPEDGGEIEAAVDCIATGASFGATAAAAAAATATAAGKDTEQLACRCAEEVCSVRDGFGAHLS
jgi:hypothetical protein